ncbi:MFS general substrate transporter [Lactarius hatsudake]|nr:MFS general substrate transporter [Lactarius hatsudake]
MSFTRFDNHDIDEETPFLPNQEDLNPTWLAESILSNSISPYLNQLVRELPEVGGDARKVGYYTGIIVHLATSSERVEWNRLSDHVGRKPVLLSCLVGTTLSTLLFGLSRSLWALVLSQCLLGAVTGHVGVVSSMTAELTDETNVAQGFSMLPVAWSLGRPPHVLSHSFWADYPYFLPCLVAASYILGLCNDASQTLDSGPSERLRLASPNSDSPQREAGDSPDLDMSSNGSDKPLPLRSVLTRPVVVTIANYALFAMLSAGAGVYIPLVWSTPVEYGGLNLDPASIGLGLSVYGGMGGFFQFVFFSHFVSRFGLRRVFVLSIASCRHYGYGAMNIYISSAAPNKRSLGTVYGLSHVATSVTSAVGQVAADWLFAFSLTHNVLRGKFAYVVFLGVVCIEVGVSTQLPKNTWAHLEE